MSAWKRLSPLSLGKTVIIIALTLDSFIPYFRLLEHALSHSQSMQTQMPSLGEELGILFLVFQNVSLEGTEEKGNGQCENSIFPSLKKKPIS